MQGRCAACRWLSVCGGNFRARAEAVQAVAGGRLGTFAEALAAALEDYARSLNRRYDGDREKLKRQGKLS